MKTFGWGRQSNWRQPGSPWLCLHLHTLPIAGKLWDHCWRSQVGPMSARAQDIDNIDLIKDVQNSKSWRKYLCSRIFCDLGGGLYKVKEVKFLPIFFFFFCLIPWWGSSPTSMKCFCVAYQLSSISYMLVSLFHCVICLRLFKRAFTETWKNILFRLYINNANTFPLVPFKILTFCSLSDCPLSWI